MSKIITLNNGPFSLITHTYSHTHTHAHTHTHLKKVSEAALHEELSASNEALMEENAAMVMGRCGWVIRLR